MQSIKVMFDRVLPFYKGKKVFVTGHNGFKGSWMSKVLDELGAEVFGYSLPIHDGLISSMKLDKKVQSEDGDIRDLKRLQECINDFSPNVVIHMAAQPIVLTSYKNPVLTYETNVMGTVNILESIRNLKNVSFVNVTTDKVYRNLEDNRPFIEEDFLDGYDPYSNSKSCSELVTATYRRSFFENSGTQISTCRAGNVIGGGDMAPDRIIPDCIRAASENRSIEIRNPASIRPYQHVLEPVMAYLMVAARQSLDPSLAGSYNIGPMDDDYITTQKLVETFCDYWDGAKWNTAKNVQAPHECNILKLNSDKVKRSFGWKQVWGVNKAVEMTARWHRAEIAGKNMGTVTSEQIGDYLRSIS